MIAWLSQMLFGTNSLSDLAVIGVCDEKSVLEAARGSRAFVAELRTRLHYMTARAEDRLSFDMQARMAAHLGYADSPQQPGVVRFMRDYYRHAATLDFFGRRVLARARLYLRPGIIPDVKRLKINDDYYIGAGGINRSSPVEAGGSSTDLYQGHPLGAKSVRNPLQAGVGATRSMNGTPDRSPGHAADAPTGWNTPSRGLLEAFQMIATTNCELDIRLVDLIRSSLHLVDEAFRNDPEVCHTFVEVFGAKGKVGKAARAMMKTGFLEKFIPEFGKIRFLPNYDSYHHYTVDQHTILVLEGLDYFSRAAVDDKDGLLGTIMSRLENPRGPATWPLCSMIWARGTGAGHELRGETTRVAGPRVAGLARSRCGGCLFPCPEPLGHSPHGVQKGHTRFRADRSVCWRPWPQRDDSTYCFCSLMRIGGCGPH